MQCGCDSLEIENGYVSLPTFDTADIGAVQSGCERKALLGKTLFQPNPANSGSDPAE